VVSDQNTSTSAYFSRAETGIGDTHENVRLIVCAAALIEDLGVNVDLNK
jgi:hypothetical protein